MTSEQFISSESDTVIQINVVCVEADAYEITKKLNFIKAQHQLPLSFEIKSVDKVNNKALKYIDDTLPIIITEFDKQQNILASIYQPASQKIDKGEQKKLRQAMKVSLGWHKLQRRIVTAGRKTELLMQACKLVADSKVIDATAGFGHDSLIMASSGASVTLIERNPIIALLLLLERARMQSEKNWQALMSRLTIIYGNLLESATQDQFTDKVDVVYLDPMFPSDSYEGAKVSKGMQLLHTLALPPCDNEERELLSAAKASLTESARVVIKRPKGAPYLAKVEPSESWKNDVVRFDAYFS